MEKKTIEEAAKEYANGFEYDDIISNKLYVMAYQGFRAGAEWYAKNQSEQMYSEEEVIELIKKTVYKKESAWKKGQLDKWFEQELKAKQKEGVKNKKSSDEK